MAYLNFQTEFGKSRWQRSAFFERWWQLGSSDSRWTPPFYHTLRQDIAAPSGAHLERMRCVFLYQEAARRSRSRANWDPQAWVESASLGAASLGVLTSAAGVLVDPRLEPGSGYLFLPHAINDPGSVEALFDALAGVSSDLGVSRLTGPVSFSPHLQSGLQLDHWHRSSPALACGNPPYLPELLAQHMQPLDPALMLWQLELPGSIPESGHTLPVEVASLELPRLAGDLLPLFAAACQHLPGIPPPDQSEAQFLLARLPPGVAGWLALQGGEPVGFAIAGAEISPALRRWRGGRNPLSRLALSIALNLPFEHGRVYFCAVLPEHRRQGIAAQLYRSLALHAFRQGWRSLVIGPLLEHSPGAQFLVRLGAHPAGEYRLFELEW